MIKRWVFFELLLLMLLNGCNDIVVGDRSEEQGFEFSVSGCSVEFPQFPQGGNELLKTEFGWLMLRNYWTRASDSGSVLSISYTDYPTDTIDTSAPLIILDALVAGLVSQRDYQRVTVERGLTLDGHPGVAIEATIPQGRFVKSRVYVVENWVYIVQATGSERQVSSEEVDKFFESFHLEPQDTPVETPDFIEQQIG